MADLPFAPSEATSPGARSGATAELARLDELVRILRARCPWDKAQTHVSLGPHLLEETYEALDAIEDLSSAEPTAPAEVVEHLREELGDVLVQVFFHSVLAEEEGRFTLADVAREIHDKLVSRHPHVFGDAVAETPDDVAARWEALKKQEKGRRHATDGIPDAMPSLALASKLLRKAQSQGIDVPSAAEWRSRVAANLERLDSAAQKAGAGSSGEVAGVVGELLLAVADLAQRSGVDPETALRAEARKLRQAIESQVMQPPS